MRAIIVAEGIRHEVVSSIRELLVEAGFHPVDEMPAVPPVSVVPEPCMMVLNETVSGRDCLDYIGAFGDADVAFAVTVSPPYVETINRIRYPDPGSVSRRADMVIIVGSPEDPSHIDIGISATTEPRATFAMFRRIRKSIEEG